MQKIPTMLLTLLFINTLLACGKEDEKLVLTPPIDKTPQWLEGKLKKIIQTTSQHNKIITEISYDETTKEVSGIIVSDSATQTITKETFKRNEEGKIIEAAIEHDSKGAKTKSVRTYEYNSNKLLKHITEEFAERKVFEDLVYDIENHLITYTRNQYQNNRPALLLNIQYTWKNSNVSAIQERGVGGYEETDFVYSCNPNNLGKVFSEQIKTPVYLPEQISQNLLTFQQKLFEGTRMKYEYEYNRDNRLVSQKSLVNDKKVAELKIEYY